MFMMEVMPESHGLWGQLDLLVPLEALLETESVTAAARRIGVTQPAMSRILERLRDAFGDPLLVRVGGRMEPTPRALALKEPLAAVLRGAKALYAPSAFDPKQAELTFRAVLPDVIAAPLLPRLLARLARAAPRCRLQLVAWAARESERATLSFAITSEVDNFPTYRREPLFRDRDVLAGKVRPRRGVDPLSLDHVAVVAAGLAEDPADRWLATLGRTRRIVAVVPSYLLALQAIARAPLYAILPSRMVAALGAPLRVRGYPLPLAQDDDQQWLLYPPEREADPASRWLRALVADVCRDEA